MTIMTLGIDLGKSVCSLVGMDAAGAVVLRRKIKRNGVLTFTVGLAPCQVALANKLARIAWAVLVHGTTYEASHAKA